MRLSHIYKLFGFMIICVFLGCGNENTCDSEVDDDYCDGNAPMMCRDTDDRGMIWDRGSCAQDDTYKYCIVSKYMSQIRRHKATCSAVPYPVDVCEQGASVACIDGLKRLCGIHGAVGPNRGPCSW